MRYIQTRDSDYEELMGLLMRVTGGYPIAIDTETTGLFDHASKIRLLQLGTEGQEYVLDAFSMDIIEVCGLLIKKARAGDIQLYAHNWAFDLKMLWLAGFDFGRCNVFCTQNMSKVASGYIYTEYTLAACCENFLDIILDKEEQRSDWSTPKLSRKQLLYAAKDAEVTRKLGMKLLRLINYASLMEVHLLETRVTPAIASMEWNGVYCNMARLSQMAPIYKDAMARAEADFLTYVPTRRQRRRLDGTVYDLGFNVSSATQMAAFVKQQDVPNPAFGVGGDENKFMVSTGSTLLKQVDYANFPWIPAILEYRKRSKILSGYINSLPGMVNPVTGLIHTHYNQMVSTGRLSSSEPNLQNLSRPENATDISVRSCFEPRSPDNVFIGNDYSQIELRVMAQLLYSRYKDTSMLDEFIAGLDPYAAAAAKLNNLEYFDIVDVVDGEHVVKKEAKKIRQGAKAVRLGFNYCFAGTTMVCTPSGDRRINTLQVGDVVLTHTGKYQPVTATQKVYADDIIRVVTSTGKHLTMTPDHKMMVTSAGKYSWVEAADLSVGQYLVDNTTEYGHADVGYFPSVDYARMVGWFLSEGYMGRSQFYISQCPDVNPEVFSKMSQILSPLGFYISPGSPNKFMWPMATYRAVTSDMDIDFEALSRRKTFHAIRDRLSREEKIALIESLWEGDGSVIRSGRHLHALYASLSRALVDDIKYVLKTLSIDSYVTRRPTGLYILYIGGGHSKKYFCDIINIQKTEKGKAYYSSPRRPSTCLEKIVSIRPMAVKQHPMYDITVANDHSFIAEGLVSHNCMGAPKFRLYAHYMFGVIMTPKESEQNRRAYMELYPGLKAYHADCKDKNRRSASSFPPFNRLRRWSSYPGPSSIANTPVQSTAGDALKLAIALCYEELDEAGFGPLKSNKVMLLLNIHDEMVMEAHRDYEQYAREMTKRHMEYAGSLSMPDVPITADPITMQNLADK